MNQVNIGSDNGLSPIQRQAIIQTNAGPLSIARNKQWNFNRNTTLFIYRNALENIVCEMAAILAALNFKTLGQRQNGCQFADISSAFYSRKIWILIDISLKFVPRGSTDNNSPLVEVMAWHETGIKPLSEPMTNYFTDAYMCHWTSMSPIKWSQTPSMWSKLFWAWYMYHEFLTSDNFFSQPSYGKSILIILNYFLIHKHSLRTYALSTGRMVSLCIIKHIY